ncbi:MAG TPA: transposase [Rhodanobacteraceae bacterium]|nr:transposase [Rhodanobacteraceae bacterium]
MPATVMPHQVPHGAERLPPGHHALRKGRVSVPDHVYLVTTVTRERKPYFRDFAVGCAAARCFDQTRTLGDACMLAWVLMPDHVHWMIRLGRADTLEAVVNRLKSASARAANRTLRRDGSLWARAFHDHALRAEEDLRRSARYVIANPVRARLVERVGDYPFWNAAWV